MSDPQDGTAGQAGAGDRGASRPQPAYGEYAPEGWSWTPPGAENEADGASGSGGGTAASGQGSGSRSASGSGAGSAVPPGVPHNLGVAPGAAGQPGTQSGSTAAAPTRTPTRPGEEPAPYRADQPKNAPAQQPQAQRPQFLHPGVPAAPGQPGAAAPRKPRTGDRVVTILLLVFGAFGALNIASSFFALGNQIRLMATMIGLENVEPAGWVNTLGTVSGLATLLLFALTAIYSIQRMRAGKIAFWVPLAAGGIAFVLLMVIPMIAMTSTPEIMQAINSDPNGTLSKMMTYVENMGQQ
ncbi:DUF6264 family protein [Leucobacter luti]|uniref:DUF6264 family protein n=1 Tax=Leucobacter luti TaxID=340320 RepID=UPI003D03A26B